MYELSESSKSCQQNFSCCSPLAEQPHQRIELLSKNDINRFRITSNLRGASRLFGHIFVISLLTLVYHYVLNNFIILVIPTAVFLGFSYASMFACMHECLHKTAFRTKNFNSCVAAIAGTLAFYNPLFFSYAHAQHHRFTQIPGKDPELEDPKPSSWIEYTKELSGILWWTSQLKILFQLISFNFRRFPYIPESKRTLVSVTSYFQALLFLLLVAVDVGFLFSEEPRIPTVVLYWLIPLIAGQPILRLILLCDHTGCSFGNDSMNNTRTTYTNRILRFLMWEMCFHAEHHRYPAIPFFRLSDIHNQMSPHLTHISFSGYTGAQSEIVSSFAANKEISSRKIDSSEDTND